MKRLIALYSSCPGSGKSEVALIINKLLLKTKTYSFAAPLKAMVCELLVSFGYTEEEASSYVFSLKGEPLKKIPGEPTSRYLHQTLGTDWGRNMIHSNLWTEACLQGIRRDIDTYHCVCDDLRFPGEYESLSTVPTVEFWKVERPEIKRNFLSLPSTVTKHPSEYLLEGHHFDKVIMNDGDIKDLEKKVLLALQAANY